MRKARSTALALGLLGTAAATLAQQTPPIPSSGGGILNEVERRLPSQPLQTPEGAKIEIPDAPALNAASSTQRVTVRGYDVRGNTVFDIKTIANLLQPHTGELSLAQLYAAVDEVTQYYRRHGYLLARAYLPQQEIKDGQVTIAILEGRYGKVATEGESRVGEQRVTRTLEEAMCNRAASGCEGALISRAELERGLLLLNDLPGAQAAARLAPGDVTGTSALGVAVHPENLVSGLAQIDNGGNYYSGVVRGMGTLWLNSPAGIGDQLTLQGVAAGVHGDLYYGTVGYGVPLGYSGLRLAVRGSYLRYGLGDRYETLDVHGTVKGGDASLNYPFIRSLRGNLYGSIGYGERRFQDDTDAVGLTTERKISGRTEAGLSGDLQDGLLGAPAVNTFSLLYTWGELELDPMLGFVDRLTARTAGDYGKWMLGYSRLQALFGNSSLFVRAAAQGTSDNLDSYEKFALGGPDSVRAYPAGEMLADEAVLYSIEWRQRIPAGGLGTFEGVLFYDRARGDMNADPWIVGGNRVTLEGTGVGLNWASGGGLMLRSTIAWRGDRPMTAAPDHGYQYNLSMSMAF